MKNFLLVVAATIIVIAGCSINTPNSVAINTAPTYCVLPTQYAQGITPPPQIANNTTNSTYCISVTVQNNNTGQNSNNIQVTTSGLQLSYQVGNQTFSATLYDPVAATIQIQGSVESIGNIEIFDPLNCVTTQGSKVITLGYGGQSCTFYLQVMNEAYPVGIYPTLITYNYTNGSQNYSISTNFNQRVMMLAGGSSGAYSIQNNQWQNQLPNGTSGAIGSIVDMDTDNYGNIYFATSNAVFKFNGVTLAQLGQSFSGVTVTAVGNDNGLGIYAATTKGIYEYGQISGNWQILPSSQNISFNDVQGGSNNFGTYTLYASTNNSVYSCNNPESGYLNCNLTLITNGTTGAPNVINPNTLTPDSLGNLYLGSSNKAYSHSGSGAWESLVITPYATGNVSRLSWNIFNNIGTLYLGETSPQNPNESTTYVCSIINVNSPTCTPLLSESGNPIIGNSYDVETDPYGNVYVVGANLASPDFAPGPYSGAYLPESGTTALGKWTPITGSINLGLTNAAVSTMLTSY